MPTILAAKGYAEAVHDLAGSMQDIASCFDCGVDGVGLIVVFEVDVEAVDGGEIPDDVVAAMVVLVDLFEFVEDVVIEDDICNGSFFLTM